MLASLVGVTSARAVFSNRTGWVKVERFASPPIANAFVSPSLVPQRDTASALIQAMTHPVEKRQNRCSPPDTFAFREEGAAPRFA
jgi:hypothetical protein